MFKILKELTPIQVAKSQEISESYREEDRIDDLLSLNREMNKAGEKDLVLLKKIRDELRQGDKEEAHKQIDALLKKYGINNDSGETPAESPVETSVEFDKFEEEILDLHFALSKAMRQANADKEIINAMRDEIKIVYDLGKAGNVDRAMRELHQFSEKHKNWLR